MAHEPQTAEISLELISHLARLEESLRGLRVQIELIIEMLQPTSLNETCAGEEADAR